MRLINFAHGELIMIGAYGLFFIDGPPWAVRILVVLGSWSWCRAAMERVAFRPARGADADTLLVTSFAVSFLLQNLAILVFGALPRSVAHLAVPDRVGTRRQLHDPERRLVTVGTAVPAGRTRAVPRRGRGIGVQMRAAAENFRWRGCSASGRTR